MNQLPHDVGRSLRPETRQARLPISSTVIAGIAFFFDSIAILGSGAVLFFWLININANTVGLYAACVCSIWMTTVMLFHYSELYVFQAIVRPSTSLDKMIIAFGTGFLFLLAAAFSIKVSSDISRVWIAAFAASSVLLTIFARLALWKVVQYLSNKGVFSRNMIIAGSKLHVSKLLKRIVATTDDFITVTALFIDKPSDVIIDGRTVMGDLEAIPAYVRASSVDDVVIALPWSEEERILTLVEQLRELPVNVYLGSDLIGMRLDFGELPGHLSNAPVFSVVGHPMSGWAVAIKAAEDYILTLVFLSFFAIPMAVIGILIWLDSPGPVLFKQRRLGFNNQTFWIYKFRSMYVEGQPEPNTVQAKRDDPRVTRIGRFLRRSSLDELPQLFNVLAGNMSLVGPRPHAVDHNAEYSQKIRGYFARHRVKPGITGYAQVNGLRGETDTPEKMADRVRHDVYYTENWSLSFDLKILLQTAIVLFTSRNAY